MEQRRWTNFIDRQQPMAGEEGRFPIYARAVKDRLLKHGFTRTFQLDEDPTRQDSLTTWIEYLGYEYWWYDRFALSNRQQQWLDRKWKEVVDSQVLKPFETQESVRGFRPVLPRYNELEQSREVVEATKSTVILAQKAISDPQNYSHPLKKLERTLQEAQFKLAAAEERRDFLTRRNKIIADFCTVTVNSQISKESAERHTILLRWILEQLPMVELEMKQAGTAANTSNDESVRGKSKLDQADQLSSGECPSDQGINDMENLTTLDCQAPMSITSQGNNRRKRSHDIPNEERPSKRSRRNSRNSAVPNRKISKSIAATSTTEVATEASHGPNSPVSRMTRQKRNAATVVAEEERDVKEVDKVSGQSASPGKRPLKQQKHNTQNRVFSGYDIAAHTAAGTKAAAEGSHDSKTSSSRMTRQKRKAVTMAANEKGDVEMDKIPSRGASLRSRRQKNMSFPGPLLSSTTTEPLRRSLRLAQKRVAV